MVKISRRTWLWGGLAAALLLAVPSLLAGCNTYLRYQGWSVTRESPEALSKLLSPAYRVFQPEGAGPWPTALLFSGCDGPKDNMERWAGTLNASGWGAVVVDSHTPRGYGEMQRWRLICAGQLLTGGERAGDVAVALDDVRRMPGVDPDRIALIGASHGGWAILDLLSLRGQGRLPFNLSRWPDSVEERGLDGVAGVMLLYPYCGVGSQVSRHGWEEDIPALFLLVDDDTIANEQACIDVADRMKQRGRDVEVHVFEGTTHGFDQVSKNALSNLEFSPETTGRAQEIGLAFLDRVAGPTR